MKTIATLVLSLLTLTASAQPKATPLEVRIDQVNDRRTTGSFAQLLLVLELPKIQNSEMAASRVLVSAATDDAGQSLLADAAAEPELQANMQKDMAGKYATKPATVMLTLKNPSRKAKQVKEVRGEIELFLPARDPNSIAEVAKFTTLGGKPIASKALKANGIEIALLSTAQVDAERKKIVEAKRKEYKESGFEDGESLESMLQYVRESTLPLSEGEFLIRLKDPNHRIQEMEFVDGAGEVQRANQREGDAGLTYLTVWGDAPKPDWKLRVNMRTAKNIIRSPFTLKDVPLP